MKPAIIAFSFLLAATSAMAQSRPLTTNMSCAAANSLVRARGAVVLATGRDLYDRYVASLNFCGPGEMLRASFVPSGDNPQCFIGYLCIFPSYDSR